MTSQDVIAALQLPIESRIDQRITKKLLVERSRGTAAQKRSLQDGIEELIWIASLKPHTVGVAAYRDDAREYLEIAVLLVRVRESAKANRLTELIHRAIPYPVFVIAEQVGQIAVSLAHKRWSEAEHGETIAEDVDSLSLSETDPAATGLFLNSLGLATVHAADMRALYQGWLDRMTAFHAASLSGTYTVPETSNEASALRQALATYATLARERSGLRALAQKEVQVSRRVELNLAVKRIEGEMTGLLKNFDHVELEQAGLGETENDEAVRNARPEQ